MKCISRKMFQYLCIHFCKKIAFIHVKVVQRQIFRFGRKKYEHSSFCIQHNQDGSEVKVVCSSDVFFEMFIVLTVIKGKLFR